MSSRPPVRVLPYWIGPVATILGGVIVGVLGGGIVAGLVSGYGPALPPGGLFGIGVTAKSLFTTPGEPGQAWAGGNSLGGPVVVWGSIIAVLVVYCIGVGLASAAWSRHQMQRRHGQDGFADKAELRRRGLTEPLARKAGLASRPILSQALGKVSRRNVPTEALAVRVGELYRARDTDVWAQFRDGALIEGPTGSGKTWRIAWHRVVDSPGFVLATTTKPDLLWSTLAARARVGQVFVFDPEGISAWPDKLRWSIIAGCDDPDTALRRAEALVNAMPIDDAKNGAYFTAKATVLMRCYLYAAARLGESIRTVRVWASSRNVPAVRNVLADELPDWSKELEQTLGSQADSSEDIIGATSRLLEPLASPSLLDAVDVPADESADLRSIITSGSNSLYLLSEGTSGSVAPFVAALAAEVYHLAKEHALLQPQQRLDPPALFVLDEVNNVAPIPNLVDHVTDSAGRGLCLWMFAHSESQNRDRWGQIGGRRLTTESPIRVILPGLADDQELASLSRLIGDREQYHSPRMAPQRVPIMPAADIRQMPADMALVIYRGARPALVRLPTVWDVPDLKAAVIESKDYYDQVCMQQRAVDAA